MEEKRMLFWVSVVGVMQKTGNCYLGEKCPICGDGRQVIRVGGDGESWSCLVCGESGSSVRELLVKLHSDPAIVEKIICKYGLEKSAKKAVQKNGKK